ncbi:16S rRNA (guanine(527)-N(7))-methyltransferase RsmG [Miniphocaeibacter halophilus]|uniref:16S rRNA (Guanine(527)-N(7))-methyltransferase RsmG n=1 Tax=Miniphocaeibacter halophilus TaxID=2931922 RepID=A0AC61MT92_9FIRM|nr:16S rRNA (guanine(527)-N(7))-methyltransferase RsmG [Miniphocaeibacter halophilus]QQK08920.1 16S rRNA (guanine(527)-N(7))-methyltransferase RsmG [Miniphocaeibacter halophilus]
MSKLEELFVKNEFKIDENQLDNFEKYRDLLVETNKVLNLTSITEEVEVNYKHFLDSILPLKYVDIRENSSLIDIGTGAGLPGLPIKFVRKDLNIVLMDSLNKRIKFLNKVIGELKLEKIEAIHGRAEEMGRNAKYREKYDYAISRAVSRLNTLVEYCLPFVKVGGYFISMKGPSGHEEYAEAKKAIETLGGKLEKIIDYNLDYEDSERTLIIIKKIKNTNKKYPRAGGKPKSKPL